MGIALPVPGRFDEVLFEVFERLVIQVELPLESAIGNAPFAGQKCARLVDDFRELHTPPKRFMTPVDI